MENFIYTTNVSDFHLKVALRSDILFAHYSWHICNENSGICFVQLRLAAKNNLKSSRPYFNH